jgi:SAM domain (Sterile alpha motif)
MQQIADWLKKLGMSEYAQRFADNDIDTSVLSELTDQDLKDLGVSLGHRRKMLRAIRDLGGASVAVTELTVPAATEPSRRDDAERRQLTVMRCWNASLVTRTRGYAISALRNIPTARSIQLLARWNAPLGWRTTIRRRCGSISLMLC